MVFETAQAHAGRGTSPNTQDAIEAAQAWLQDCWEGLRADGRPDLAERAWKLIAELERIRGEAS